jgi:hypothetical protein
MQLEGLEKSKKKIIHLIGSRTRDLPACSIATQHCIHILSESFRKFCFSLQAVAFHYKRGHNSFLLRTIYSLIHNNSFISSVLNFTNSVMSSRWQGSLCLVTGRPNTWWEPDIEGADTFVKEVTSRADLTSERFPGSAFHCALLPWQEE